MTYAETQPPIPAGEPVCANCAHFRNTYRSYGSGVCDKHRRDNAALVVEHTHTCKRFKSKLSSKDNNGRN